MNETLEQMEARHAKERAELIKRMTRRAYKAGSESRVPKEGPRLDYINLIVAQKHKVKPSDMVSHTRVRKIARARFEAFSRAKRAGFSLNQIGQFFGNRDHTTVMAGIRRHEEITSQQTVGFDQ